MANSKGRYSYSENQKEINKALKMQEIELSELNTDSDMLANKISEHEVSLNERKLELEDLKSRIEDLQKKSLSIANNMDVKVPSPSKFSPNIKNCLPNIEKPYLVDLKISRDEIPSWENVMEKTDKIVSDDIILENLLSQKEFQYCIDDVKRINDEFARRVKLNKTDMIFLITAAALQSARWILIQYLNGELGERGSRLNNKEGDKIKKHDLDKWNKKNNNHENTISEHGYPTWKDILFGQYPRTDGLGKSHGTCPYDAQANAPFGFTNGGLGNHRLYTLGHDPILGWIFGTANIMTCTISLSKQFGFSTYRVEYPGGRFGNRILMPIMFKEMFESIYEDKFRLVAALFTQYAHLKSDVFTKNGLPVPLVEAFSENLAGKLYSEQYDALCLAKDAKIVGCQAFFSIFINMIIGLLHGLFYKEEYGSREHYEVRTRKILLYSNTIATSVNLAYVGVNASYGNIGEALKKIDLGGLLVNLYRLFSDIRFITKIKNQFIQEEMDKIIQPEIDELDSMFE